MKPLTPQGALRCFDRLLPQHVRDVIQTLKTHGAQAYVVGGAPRDLMLRRPVSDWDLATDAVPDAMVRWFKRVNPAGARFGTVMVITSDGPVEITTFRGEGPYTDGRRPAWVHFLPDLHKDLARRDFTINAMAVGGEPVQWHDPFGGSADLQGRLIRCVGDPLVRFAEDGLRIVRAVRFAAILGFRIHKNVMLAMKPGTKTLEKVAWERKGQELRKMLAHGQRLAGALQVLDHPPLWKHLFASVTRAQANSGAKHVEKAPAGDLLLRTAVFFAAAKVEPKTAKTLMRTWHYAKSDGTAVEHVLTALAEIPRTNALTASIRRWLAQTPRAHRELLIATSRYAYPRKTELADRARTQLRNRPCLDVSDLDITGHDVHALGYRDAQVGQALNTLLQRVVDNPRLNKKETLVKLLKS